jgi:hypothetical protein
MCTVVDKVVFKDLMEKHCNCTKHGGIACESQKKLHFCIIYLFHLGREERQNMKWRMHYCGKMYR